MFLVTTSVAKITFEGGHRVTTTFHVSGLGTCVVNDWRNIVDHKNSKGAVLESTMECVHTGYGLQCC